MAGNTVVRDRTRQKITARKQGNGMQTPTTLNVATENIQCKHQHGDGVDLAVPGEGGETMCANKFGFQCMLVTEHRKHVCCHSGRGMQ
jgi:hypothetical protein